MEGKNGIYHINAVDITTQFEIVFAVPRITDEFMIPVIEMIIKTYPFKIFAFHSDNGSEYINYVIAEMLNRLLVRQTKSRPRHSNDNALVESKNGSIIRKHIGYGFIPQEKCALVNLFYEKLKTIHKYTKYLKDGITAENLNKIAFRYTDNEFAKIMQKAKAEMFSKIKLSIPEKILTL